MKRLPLEVRRDFMDALARQLEFEWLLAGRTRRQIDQFIFSFR